MFSEHSALILTPCKDIKSEVLSGIEISKDILAVASLSEKPVIHLNMFPSSLMTYHGRLMIYLSKYITYFSFKALCNCSQMQMTGAHVSYE